jgi:hypothetical protein
MGSGGFVNGIDVCSWRLLYWVFGNMVLFELAFSSPKQPITLKAFPSSNSVLRLLWFYGPSSFLWLFKCFPVDPLR